MNSFEYHASRLFLNVFGFFFGLLPLDRSKVVFASARDEHPGGNLAVLEAAYRNAYPQAHIVTCYRSYSYGLAGKIAYLFSLVKTTYHLKTARYFFVDNALFPVHVVAHRSGTQVIQVWHATGLLKRFGLDTQVAERKVENHFIHQNYDAVIADSAATADAYAHAFGTPRKNVLVLGSARTDQLRAPGARERARHLLEARFPQLKGKRVVLYAPTFRGFSVGKAAASTLDAAVLRNLLDSSYALIIKPHAVAPESDRIGFDAVLNADDDLNEIMAGTDALITDYSSTMFEYYMTHQPVFKFCPDLDDYLSSVGLYIPYDQLPGCAVTTVEDLARELVSHEAIDETAQGGSQPTLNCTEQEHKAAETYLATYCSASDGQVVARYLTQFPLD